MKIITKTTLWILAAALQPSFANAANVDTVAQLSSLFSVALSVASFLGVMLFANGLMAVYQSQTGRGNKTIGQALISMFVGTFMLSVGWVYGLMKASFVGANSTGINYEGRGSLALDAAAISAGNAAASTGYGKFMPAQTLQSIFAFVFLVGLIAFIHGVYLLRNVGAEGGNSDMKRASFYRILGGLMCMNITWFSCLVGGILGIDSMCFGE
jgi:hypothetical protein